MKNTSSGHQLLLHLCVSLSSDVQKVRPWAPTPPHTPHTTAELYSYSLLIQMGCFYGGKDAFSSSVIPKHSLCLPAVSPCSLKPSARTEPPTTFLFFLKYLYDVICTNTFVALWWTQSHTAENLHTELPLHPPSACTWWCHRSLCGWRWSRVSHNHQIQKEHFFYKR